MMGIFQSISPNARGTIASLSNAAMYAGTTVGTCLAGFLYQNTHHFGAVTAFTAILFVLSMALYQTSRKNKHQAAGFHVKAPHDEVLLLLKLSLFRFFSHNQNTRDRQ